jgi:deoxyribose-phosphate aldolase
MSQKIYSLLDLTNLSDQSSSDSIRELCEQAVLHKVAAVCLYKENLAICRENISTVENIKLATVCNFPAGTANLENILAEIALSQDLGAEEIDVVMPYHLLSAGDVIVLEKHIAAYRKACSKTLKVIIESGKLSAANIAIAANICIANGVDFIKTSTGKVEVGATLEAARIIAQAIKDHDAERTTGIKLSGGVRTLQQALEYINLITAILGDAWISPQHVRFGASKLLY